MPTAHPNLIPTLQADHPAKSTCLQPPTPHCFYLHTTKTVSPSYTTPPGLSLRLPSPHSPTRHPRDPTAARCLRPSLGLHSY
ncbi:hypothetical protein T484DRAFT_1949605 [Baffinella frigidus]|nr:hypothetical protein T484DRAFT_1949605 [Cryptophyta sp. CCMP2293]